MCLASAEPDIPCSKSLVIATASSLGDRNYSNPVEWSRNGDAQLCATPVTSRLHYGVGVRSANGTSHRESRAKEMCRRRSPSWGPQRPP